MRLHVIGLPHTRFTPEYSWCAYTQKVAKFARMMSDQGVDVITYGNGEAELPGKYVMVTDASFDPFYVPEFTAGNPIFKQFNDRATAALLGLLEPGDIICIIGGNAQAITVPDYKTVEFGIGYTGTFAPYRVWESATWESHVLGINRAYGSENDTVIYNYFDPDDFAIGKPEYFAFMGRITHCKGIDLAIAACKRAGVPLKIAGNIFEDSDYVCHLSGDIEYVGNLAPAERKVFLSGAIATFCPSRYVEPFCGVHVESMLSGVPVITSDWGVFPETVMNDEEGWRCRTLEDYVAAIGAESELSPDELRHGAIERYSMDVIGPQYLDYFEQL